MLEPFAAKVVKLQYALCQKQTIDLLNFSVSLSVDTSVENKSLLKPEVFAFSLNLDLFIHIYAYI